MARETSPLTHDRIHKLSTLRQDIGRRSTAIPRHPMAIPRLRSVLPVALRFRSGRGRLLNSWPNPRRHIDDILEARYFITEVPFEMRRRSGRRERSADKWSQPRGGPRLCRSALFWSIDDLSELRAQVCKCERLLQKCFAVPEDPHLNCAVRCKPRNIQDSEIRDGLH
jgi:hypothetical protein